MRNVRLSLCALCASALVASPVFSQPPGGGRGMGMMRQMGIGILLNNPGVQEELKLDQKQKDKIKEFAAKQREAQQGLRELDREERQAKQQELTKQAESFAKEVLSADQQKRIKQIVVQQAGLAAFAMEDVRKQLKLTEEQADKFKTLGEDLGRDMRELFSGGGDMQENMQKMRSLNKEYVGKAVGSLTDEQKKTWTELTGKPFEVKFEMQRRDR
jgi:Spy/CpxP family protein refolding chaperone